MQKIPFNLKLQVVYKNPIFYFVLSTFISFLIYYIVFMTSADLRFYDFSGEVPYVQGKIGLIIKSDAKNILGKKYKYNYQYTVNGKKYTGHSYSRKKKKLVTADILYKENNPEISCIYEMKSSTTSILTIVFYSFLVVGFFVMFLKLLSMQLAKLKVLKNGIITKASFKNKKNTGTKWRDNQYVYDVFFEFIANDGKTYETKVRTPNTERFGDELFEPIIYNQQNPTKSVLIDDLPQNIRNFLQNEVDEALKI